MQIEKIKPLVNEYAKNLSLLFVTNETAGVAEVRKYINFFNFLFKKLNFISDTKDAYDIYSHYKRSIDLVILHVSGDTDNYKKLIQAIRKLSNEVVILTFATTEEARVRIDFTLNSCFCADGFVPIPFDKDKIYMYFYRLLKRIVERQEFDGYVEELESSHDEFLRIEERFDNYIQKLKNIEHIDKDKLIAKLYSLKDKVDDELEVENRYIQEIKETTGNKINKEKLEDIRFTQTDKMTASEFVATLDDTIVDKAEDFLGILNKYIFTLDEFLQSDASQSLSYISSLTEILREFYYTVDMLTVFPAIVRTFDSIIDFLNSLSVQELEDYDKKSTLVLILEGLGNDLELWITNIFIDRVTDDIHYFDASFANNVVEMEAIFTQNEIESDEDDLEFF